VTEGRGGGITQGRSCRVSPELRFDLGGRHLDEKGRGARRNAGFAKGFKQQDPRVDGGEQTQGVSKAARHPTGANNDTMKQTIYGGKKKQETDLPVAEPGRYWGGGEGGTARTGPIPRPAYRETCFVKGKVKHPDRGATREKRELHTRC